LVVAQYFIDDGETMDQLKKNVKGGLHWREVVHSGEK
jgi:hypothetical protein